MMTRRNFYDVVGGILIAIGTMAAPARADTTYFQDKTISLIFGGGASGGNAAYARFFAPYYAKHIPGNPRIIVKGMPGAGTLIAANYIYEVAAPDGMTIGTAGGGTATADLFETRNVRFDPRRFVWLGSLTSDVSLIFSWHTTPIKSIKDVFKRTMLVGGGSVTSGDVIFPTVLNRLFGTKFKIITGYSSPAEALLAIERGELEGVASWNYSSIRAGHGDLLRDRKINMLLQLALEKHEDLPSVPLVTDLATSNEQREILDLVFSRQEMQRPYMAPPHTPEKVADTLRRAFDEVIKDPKFLSDAAQHNIDISHPMTGAQVGELIERLYGYPKDIVQKAIKLTDMSDAR
jgi:tripartite-type tricarboxylate transporter receptor subunit TctC